MKTKVVRYALGGAICVSILAGCKKENVNRPAVSASEIFAINSGGENVSGLNATTKRYYGASVKMGNGIVRSWINISKSGTPEEIGIEMTRNAVFEIPEGHDEFELSLPQEAQNLTAFDHIVIDWNSHGHPPFFYQLPHFDFHFYMMSRDARLAIPEYSENPTGFDNNPPAGFLPVTYIAPPGGEEAEMGKHWVDATAPELPWNGGALFTKTFIYGSYDGKVTFLEPMVTLVYLQSGVSFSQAYPQPALYDKHTNYPTKFNIYKSTGSQTYNVSLSSFVMR